MSDSVSSPVEMSVGGNGKANQAWASSNLQGFYSFKSKKKRTLKQRGILLSVRPRRKTIEKSCLTEQVKLCACACAPTLPSVLVKKDSREASGDSNCAGCKSHVRRFAGPVYWIGNEGFLIGSRSEPGVEMQWTSPVAMAEGEKGRRDGWKCVRPAEFQKVPTWSMASVRGAG